MRRSSAFTSTSYRRYQRRMAGHEQAQITQERRRRGRRYNQVLSPPARPAASLLASPSSDIKQPQYTGTRQSGVGPVLTCKITPFRPPRRSSRTTSTASSRQLLYSNAKNEATTAITNGMSTNVSDARARDARARATKKNTPFMFTYGSECGHATAHGVLNDLVAIASTKCKDEVGAVKLERPRPSLLI
jgi:hypothetical protein